MTNNNTDYYKEYEKLRIKSIVLEDLGELVREKFKSGNSIQIDRITLSRDEVQDLLNLI